MTIFGLTTGTHKDYIQIGLEVDQDALIAAGRIK